MTEELAMSVGNQALMTMVYIAGPILIAAMVTGIMISILQAITQINEATLTFIPKIVAVAITIVVMAPWMLQVLKDYATSIFGGAGELLR
jgi:flagellar biosynthesis protein FliQ